MRLRTTIAGLLSGGLLATVAAACGPSADEPDLIAGKRAFAEKCGSCHVLGRAGTKGIQGPNLDEAFRQALADGLSRSGITGVVRDQIKYPARVPKDSRAYMPPDLVKGDAVEDVAAYVARSAARGGEDEGLLAEAVPQAGEGEAAQAQNGELEIEATAQLAYVTNEASAEAGELTITSPNPSGTPHNIALEGGGLDEKGAVVTDGGVSEITVTVKPGEYQFYCSVPGHKEGGMVGKLTVE